MGPTKSLTALAGFSLRVAMIRLAPKVGEIWRSFFFFLVILGCTLHGVDASVVGNMWCLFSTMPI